MRPPMISVICVSDDVEDLPEDAREDKAQAPEGLHLDPHIARFMETELPHLSPVADHQDEETAEEDLGKS